MGKIAAADSSGQSSCWSRLIDLGDSEAGEIVSKQMKKASNYANKDASCFVRVALATSVTIQTIFRSVIGAVSFTAKKLFSMAIHLITGRISTLFTKDIRKLAVELFRYMQAIVLLPLYGLAGLAFPKRVYDILSTPGKTALVVEKEDENQKKLDTLQAENKSLTKKLAKMKDELEASKENSAATLRIKLVNAKNSRLSKNESEFEIANNLLNIQYSQDEPKDPLVSTQYLGYWFYIDGSDSRSKTYVNLLLRKFAEGIRQRRF